MQFVVLTLQIVGILSCVAELWTGIAVAGNGIVKRSDSPGPYWVTMALQVFFQTVLVLAFFFG